MKIEERIKQKALIQEFDHCIYEISCRCLKKNMHSFGFSRMHLFCEGFHGKRAVVMDCLGESRIDYL